MKKTSHQPIGLEQLTNQGYKEIRRTDDRQWVIMENQEGGIIYDTQRDKIIAQYKFELWGSMR